MATAKKVNKAAQVRAYQAKNPNASAIKVAKACNTNPAYVYAIRASDKGKAAKTPKQQWKITDIVTSKEPLFDRKNLEADRIFELTKGRDRVEPKQPTNTDAMLADRGTRYGTFAGHARISQNIKDAIFGGMDQEKFEALAADQVEALEMIAHKIARIVNGDPNYADSWVDIGGYAKLVSDRLETGKEV